MIFNYTDNYQFATRLLLDNNPLETVTEFKLLGTIITSDLKWDRNTNSLTKRAYSRMRLLHKVIEFGYPIEDLIQVYILYLRSLCEQSAVVWHFVSRLNTFHMLKLLSEFGRFGGAGGRDFFHVFYCSFS